jgi:hypothetical protein
VTTYAIEAAAINAAAGNAAFNAQQRLAAMLTAAARVDVAPNAAELAGFMLNLMLPHGGVAASFVPNVQQRAALQALVGPLPGAAAAIAGWWPDANSFFLGAGALRFVNFNRALVAFQLVIRIADTKYIAQKTHPLCGPVVLMESFARQYPADYVAYVCGLALNAAGLIRTGAGAKTIVLQADSNLLTKQPNHGHIAQADYIALASLRDQGHAFIHTPYRSVFTNQVLEGGTTAGTLCRWMTQAGYANVADHTITRTKNLVTKMMFFDRDVRDTVGEGLMRANIANAQAALAGHSVFLAIAGNLAHTALNHQLPAAAGGGPRRDSKFYTVFGGHWVTLLAVNFVAAVPPGPGVVAARGGVQFHIRTWGEETNAAALITIPWSKVGNWYRGYVQGTP